MSHPRLEMTRFQSCGRPTKFQFFLDISEPEFHFQVKFSLSSTSSPERTQKLARQVKIGEKNNTISVCNLTERKPEATHVITSVISRRYFADGGTELLSSACRTCRTCSTLICHWFVALSLPFPSSKLPNAWHLTAKSVKAIFRGAITCAISPIALETLGALTEIGASSIGTQGIEVAFILFRTGAFIKICK